MLSSFIFIGTLLLNAYITHFGIDRTNSTGKLIIEMLNTFDAIYNYLYLQLIEIDNIKYFFMGNELLVEAVL